MPEMEMSLPTLRRARKAGTSENSIWKGNQELARQRHPFRLCSGFYSPSQGSAIHNDIVTWVFLVGWLLMLEVTYHQTHFSLFKMPEMIRGRLNRTWFQDRMSSYEATQPQASVSPLSHFSWQIIETTWASVPTSLKWEQTQNTYS